MYFISFLSRIILPVIHVVSSRKRQFVIVFLTICIFISPLQAHAVSFEGLGLGLAAGAGICLTPIVGWLGCGIAIAGGAAIGFTAGNDLLEAIFYGIIFLANFIATTLISWAAFLLDAAIDFNTQRVIDSGDAASQVVLRAAAITTSLANLVLVAILIIVALATIAGIENYGVRRILPVFIAMALIVNFSTIFVGGVVDAGNTVMDFFWTNSNFNNVNLAGYIQRNMKISETGLASTKNLDQLIKTSGSETVGIVAQAAGSLIIIIVGLFAAYIFFRMAMIFLLRIGIFWILIMTAPLVFILGILPYTRKYFREWWDQLLNWAFIGPITFFFMFFGLIIWSSLNIQLQAAVPGEINSMSFMLVFPIILLFFMYALNISKKMAGSIANSIIDSAVSITKGLTLGTAAMAGGAAIAGIGRAALRNPRVASIIGRLQQSNVPGRRAIGKRLSTARDDAIKTQVDRLGTSRRIWEAFDDRGLISRYEHANRAQKLIIGEILMNRQTLAWTPSLTTPPATPIIPEDIAKSVRGLARGQNTGLASLYNQYVKSQGWDI